MVYHVLDLVWSESICNFVEDSHLVLVLFEGEGFLLNVEALVDASLAENILLNGSVDHESTQSGSIGRGDGFPLWWGDNLNM